MLREASKIIRAADGGHKVVFGGMGEADSLFLTRVCSEPGTVEAFDRDELPFLQLHPRNCPQLPPHSRRNAPARVGGTAVARRDGFFHAAGHVVAQGFLARGSAVCLQQSRSQRAGQGELAAVCDPEHDIQLSTEQDEDYFTVFPQREVHKVQGDKVSRPPRKRLSCLRPTASTSPRHSRPTWLITMCAAAVR